MAVAEPRGLRAPGAAAAVLVLALPEISRRVDLCAHARALLETQQGASACRKMAPGAEPHGSRRHFSNRSYHSERRKRSILYRGAQLQLDGESIVL